MNLLYENLGSDPILPLKLVGFCATNNLPWDLLCLFIKWDGDTCFAGVAGQIKWDGIYYFPGTMVSSIHSSLKLWA